VTKKGNKGKGKIKQEIRAAGPTISKGEMGRIVEAAGGNVSKALNRISSVQASMKDKDMRAPSIGSGAANRLIEQASTPVGRSSLGNSSIAQAIRSMAGRPAGPMIQGQQTPATPSTRVAPGMVIRPSGRPGTRQQPKPSQRTSRTGPYDGMMDGSNEGPVAGKPPAAPGTTETDVVANPNQDMLDYIASLENRIGEQSTYFQDIINQSQMQAQQQMAEMSNMFNQQMMGAQDMYNMQIQQANAQALAEQEAARAFMINQGRMMNPANLQIGATYGTPQLAGTQGFKASYRSPSVTPAQAATAFTAPTLATTAATTPMATQIPTVLNV